MMRLTGIHSGASTHTHGQVIRSASRNPMKSRARHSKKFGLFVIFHVDLHFNIEVSEMPAAGKDEKPRRTL